MGYCRICKKYIIFEDGIYSSCPSCGELSPYRCLECKNIIRKEDDPKECKVCDYFECPSCKAHGKNCTEKDQVKLILNKHDIDVNTAKDIVQILASFKNGRMRRTCNREVYISYAHNGKIKRVISGLKQRGSHVWQDRINTILQMPIGSKFVISSVTKKGYLGQEERCVCQYLVCVGKLQKQIDTIKDTYMRTNIEPCSHFSPDGEKWCNKCGINYGKDVIHCNKCGRETKRIMSKRSVCSMNKHTFNEVKDGV